MKFFFHFSQVNFENEAQIHGLNRRQLKSALQLDWLMRHYREQRGYYVMETNDQMVMEAVNHVRHTGMPSWQHSCVLSGTAHIKRAISSLHLTEAEVHFCSFGAIDIFHPSQAERLLLRYSNVVIVDGHDKVNRAVCQHNKGVRVL